MKRTLISTVLGATLVLSACGTTDEAGGAEADTEPTATASQECDDVTTSTGPVSLTDAFGRTVELDEPASRVAVLEWQQIEDVLSLCVTPVAVADAAGFATWNTAETLPEGVEDVGTRGEPNTEVLLAAAPDLIIMEAYTAEDESIKALEKLGVPVLATKGADAADPIGQMKTTFELIAEATGRTERAEVVLDEFDATLAEATEQLADADLSTTDFVYFDGWISGGNVALRPFGQGSLVGELGEELGLTNAWTGKVDEAYGLGQTDIEGMTEVGDVLLLHTGTVDPDGKEFLEKVQSNAVWKKLPSVVDGNAHAFPAGIWMFGGPRSSEQIVEAYVDVLTN